MTDGNGDTMDELNNIPGIAEWVPQTEMTAFWERAVLADWSGSGLIPAGENVLAYIARESARGTAFLNLESRRRKFF